VKAATHDSTRTGVFPVCGALKPFVQLSSSRATQFSIVPKARVTLSPPEQVILFAHSACARSLHAFSIVAATASVPPSVDLDELVPQPTMVTSATAKNALGTVRSRGNEVDDIARPIGLVPSDLSPHVLTVTSGTTSRAIAVTAQGPPLKWSSLPSMPEAIDSTFADLEAPFARHAPAPQGGSL